VLTFSERTRTVTSAVDGTVTSLKQDPPDGPGNELHLTVLPAGPLPPNPGEIVTSRQLAEVLDRLKATHDYVLIDAPPMFAVGDAAAMASKIDGVVAVLRLDQTTHDTLREVETFLSRTTARTLGIVVTGVPRSSKSKYYRYDQYYG
jgi:Mrp family chromosome partitioning ATPase